MIKKKFMNNAILSCKNHNDLDKKTIKKFIPGFKLMENAGKVIFNEINKKFKKNKRIKILCGPGNNGGDGFVLARLLQNKGYKNNELFCLVKKNKLKGDAKIASKKFNGKIKNFSDLNISSNDLIIDGIFGSGLKRNISGKLKKIIDKINYKKPYCLSIDIPTGVNGDTGEIKGVAIKSKQTVTFTRKKPGHLLYPGKEYCGAVVVHNIGIDLEKLKFQPYIFENHPDNWKEKFPWPNQKSHKYTRGYTLIICGEKLTGATRLAARGAARIGCGLLCLAVPKTRFEIYSVENPIALIETIEKDDDLDKILKDKRINTVLLGPGLGTDKKKIKLILKIVKEKKRNVVLDADALKNNFKKILLKKKTNIVITPHQGEFSNILQSLKIKKNKSDFEISTKLSKKEKINLILKGSTTLICSQDGRVAINNNASPFLATGGSGDVLSGMITGLISQKMDIFDACCAAVWIHGEIAKVKGPGLIAEDLPEMIPNILKKLKN